MPFKSLAQARAAFGGYLGPEMKSKAKEFASKTDFGHLPMHKSMHNSSSIPTTKRKKKSKGAGGEKALHY